MGLLDKLKGAVHAVTGGAATVEIQYAEKVAAGGSLAVKVTVRLPSLFCVATALLKVGGWLGGVVRVKLLVARCVSAPALSNASTRTA